MKILYTLMLVSFTMFGGTRLKELASLEGVRDNQLMGYGLIVGLAARETRFRRCSRRKP